MRIENTKIDHLVNPIGRSFHRPVFTWTVTDTLAGEYQQSRLVIKQGNETVYDTKEEKIDPLGTRAEMDFAPRTRYTWTVLVKSTSGEEAVSQENFFETGKMDEAWSGKWINAPEEDRAPVFSVCLPHEDVAQARLYICGLGLYRCTLNGEKIGDEYLTPFCNNYNAYVQSETYDITEKLQEGGALSVTLGNGWYNGRFGFRPTAKPVYSEGLKLIAEVHIKFNDGHEEVIGTDDTWKISRSTITFSNIYDGEHRDDTLAQSEEGNACICEAPRGKLIDRISVPLCAHETFVPEIIHTPAGETVLDMKQNFAGIFRMHVHGKKGAEIHLQFGELLQDGSFYRDNLRTAKAEYCFVCDGEDQVIEPWFTFYGYRYVKVEGYDEITPDDFTGIALYSEIHDDYHLETGNELINQLIRNAEWGMKSNYLDVPTDCPQRDERMGWTGDAQVFSAAAMNYCDPYAFFRKYLYDMASEQEALGGLVPDVVPSFGMRGGTAVWGDAAVIIPWHMYQYFGDASILEEQYPSMRAWIDYIQKVDGDDHGWGKVFQYGDWLALDGEKSKDAFKGGTDDGFIAYAYEWNSIDLTAQTAKILGHQEEARQLEERAAAVKQYILDEYYSKNGRCTADTQTGMVLSLLFGLGDEKKCADELCRLLTMNHGKLATGFAGTPFLCSMLVKAGHADEAYKILFNEEYPGWLYEVKLGATTIWERWNSLDESGHISSTGMNSLNHYSYGSIVRFLFETSAGLKFLEPGYRKAEIRPIIHWKMRHLDAVRNTAAGQYCVSWKIMNENTVHLDVQVPFGSSAVLYLPGAEGAPIELKSGKYAYDYHTDEPIIRIYSTKDSLEVLLKNEAMKAVLVHTLPEITQLPPSMQKASLRDTALKMAGERMLPLLNQLDQKLKDESLK